VKSVPLSFFDSAYTRAIFFSLLAIYFGCCMLLVAAVVAGGMHAQVVHNGLLKWFQFCFLPSIEYLHCEIKASQPLV
jgi:hypothetical protein